MVFKGSECNIVNKKRHCLSFFSPFMSLFFADMQIRETFGVTYRKMFMWQKVIMKINVSYLFHCKRLTPYKDKHYVQIVRFSFLPCPRVRLIVLIMATIIQSPDIVQVLGLLVILHVRIYFHFDLFNKHVEKDFLQHGLGTPYSNSACFDKDDIWNFCSFLYSACQRHYFSPSP